MINTLRSIRALSHRALLAAVEKKIQITSLSLRLHPPTFIKVDGFKVTVVLWLVVGKLLYCGTVRLSVFGVMVQTKLIILSSYYHPGMICLSPITYFSGDCADANIVTHRPVIHRPLFSYLRVAIFSNQLNGCLLTSLMVLHFDQKKIL